MEDFARVCRWVTRNFISISLAIYMIIYLRWFQLTPLMFYNDSDYAYLAGLILLGLYALFATLTRLAGRFQVLQVLLFIPSAILFLGSIAHTISFFPKVEFTTKCNGKTYYITWMHPFGDYQWTFDNVTIWTGPFTYDSFFFGYSGGGYEIICDEEKKEANIIRMFNDVLVYTDGRNPRGYYNYTGTQLGDHLYFLAEQCNDWIPSTCGSTTYTLYECNLSYKFCDPLPIQYTQYDSSDFLDLSTDENTNEVKLHEEDFETDENVLIFTYGEYPRCYVEGCEILK